MTNYVASITVDAVIEALQAFIQLFLPPGALVIRTEVNRVAPPPSPYVALTELFEKDLNIPYDIFEGTNQITDIQSSTQIDIQVDFYGTQAGDFCKAFKNAFRSEWGVAQFGATTKPLYCDDGRQMPLITGEDQYERRWTLTASLQYNPVVTVPQQSATAVTVKIFPPVNEVN